MWQFFCLPQVLQIAFTLIRLSIVLRHCRRRHLPQCSDYCLPLPIVTSCHVLSTQIQLVTAVNSSEALWFCSFRCTLFQVPSKGVSDFVWQRISHHMLHNAPLWLLLLYVICVHGVRTCTKPLWKPSLGRSRIKWEYNGKIDEHRLSWLHNGDVWCFLWGTNWIYICY
jgi:hypothetical protein